MNTDLIAAAIGAEALPASYRRVVESYWQPLADAIAIRAQDRSPLLVGINGAQGSGKSTCCKFLQILLTQRGQRCAVLGLDDFYLTLAQRQQMARAIHPLFAARGVPGTHDVPLANQVLDALLAGKDADLPMFDKARDDRTLNCQKVSGPVDVILFEGWCVGAAPQSEDNLAQAVNILEAQEDPHAIWRAEVNRRLGTDYAALFARLDMLVMLKVQDFSVVARNRRLQEEKLARRSPGASGIMDETALERFCAHYERLTCAMLEELPQRADIVFEIGPDHAPSALPTGLAIAMRAG